MNELDAAEALLREQPYVECWGCEGSGGEESEFGFKNCPECKGARKVINPVVARACMALDLPIPAKPMSLDDMVDAMVSALNVPKKYLLGGTPDGRARSRRDGITWAQTSPLRSVRRNWTQAGPGPEGSVHDRMQDLRGSADRPRPEVHRSVRDVEGAVEEEVEEGGG